MGFIGAKIVNLPIPLSLPIPIFPRPPQNEASGYREKKQDCHVPQKRDSEDETGKQDAQKNEF